MTAAGEQIIALTSVGVENADLMAHLADKIRQTFGFATQLCHLLDELTFAYNESRDQYHSTAILEVLQHLPPPNAVKVLAVTQVDLFIPILTHVYGEAQLGGRAAVVSLCRLRQGLPAIHSDEVLCARAVKEAIHELGHTFQLRHCPDPRCIMHYCRSEHDVDSKSEQLCRYCRVMVADERRRLELSCASVHPIPDGH